MSNNFTFLNDIIDMDEPGNESEHKQSTHKESFNNNFSSTASITDNRNIQQYKNNLAPSSSMALRMNTQNQSYSQPKPQSYSQPKPQSYMFQEPLHYSEQLPSYSSMGVSERGSGGYSEHLNNYNELCEICRQINNQNSMMFHYVYMIIIITLIVVVLMLLKKVLNI